MEFQGKEIHIPIKGIDRSGPDGLSAEGAMTEVIGMEYFDGSYVPYKPVGSDSLLPANLWVSCVRVHKTSKQENTIIVCHDQWRHGELDNKPYATTCYVKWKPSDSRFNDTWITIMSTGWTNTISIDFIGNVLCVRLGDNSIRYFFFNGTGYEERNVNNSRPIINLRVTRGLYDSDAPTEGYIGRRYTDTKKLYTADTSDEFVNIYPSVIKPAIRNKEVASGLLTKALGLQTQEGGLTGYALACVAYRLKNGQYVAASAPILLCPPNIRNIGTSGVGDSATMTQYLAKTNSAIYNTALIGNGEDEVDSAFYPGKTDTENPGGYLPYDSSVGINDAQIGVLHAHVDGKYTSLIGGSATQSYALITGDAGRTEEGVDERNFSDEEPSLWYKKSNFGDDWDYEHSSGTSYNDVIRGTDFNVRPQGNSSDIDPNNPRILDQTVLEPALNASLNIIYNSGEDSVHLTSVASGVSNKLQFSLNSNTIDKDMIDGIGIFISEEISPFIDLTDKNNVLMHGPFKYGKTTSSGSTTVDYLMLAYTYTPKYRTRKQIKAELRRVKNMYLVKFIDTQEIQNISIDTWIDIDLKGFLGDTLRTLPSISINQLMQSTKLSGNLFTYNGRLHVFNYKANYGVDTSLAYQAYSEGIGQYDDPTVATHDKTAYTLKNIMVGFVVKNDIGNGNIIENVYKHVIGDDDGLDIDDDSLRISPLVSFKGNNIQSVIMYDMIRYRVSGESADRIAVHHMELDLQKNDDLGIAYIMNDYAMPNIYPIAAPGNTDYWTMVTQLDDENQLILNTNNNTTNIWPSWWRSDIFQSGYVEKDEYIANNGIRVSDVYYPYYFDNKSTLQVGHGTVIGMARLSIALSQDTFGRYPLLVFCTDGIYSLGVDTSGSGAYTTVTPFSREVCVNSNSICEIDGAVLFASSKGLMIATQEGVQEFCPQLNGVPRHRPVSEENAYNKDSDGHIIGPSKFWRGLGLLWYAKIIKPSLNPYAHFDEEIDGVNFIDFVADKFTYVQYAAAKNKIIVYSRIRKYYYYIDVATRNATKMKYNIAADDNNYPNTCFYHGFHEISAPQYNGEDYHEPKGNVTPGRQWFNRLSSEGNVDCLLQTRPIKLDNGLKSSYRVAVRGYFRRNMFATDPNTNIYAVLLVLGSYDGTIWNPIGYRQKDINESYCGFHGLNCDTDHVSYNYMMVIVTAPLTYASHIDGIDITAKSRRDNKLSNI